MNHKLGICSFSLTIFRGFFFSWYRFSNTKNSSDCICLLQTNKWSPEWELEFIQKVLFTNRTLPPGVKVYAVSTRRWVRSTCVEEHLHCDTEKSNKEQLYLEMEENVIIVAWHKLLVKMSVNLFRTTHDRERKKENWPHQCGFIGF